jgi:AAA family ATP:ADP antiporter
LLKHHFSSAEPKNKERPAAPACAYRVRMFLSCHDPNDRFIMAHWPSRPTSLDLFLGRFTRLRPGEGRSVVLFFTYALLMMVSYYILKTIREPLLLTGPSAEIKSYAYAATAVALLLIVPLYGLVFRHTGKQQLTRYVTGFFVVNLLLFYLAGQAGMDLAFAYYVWVGVFGLMITAQFWGFAADSYNVKSGKRLFPVIMVGASLGGLLAPWVSGVLFATVGPWLLMLVATVLLVLTLPLVGWARAAVPPGSGGIGPLAGEREHGGAFGGLTLVLTDRYLFLLALMIILLNWVNTTGEFILAELAVRHADAQLAAGHQIVKADFIAAFYGNFFFTVNLLALLAQVFLVARIMHWIGVGWAVLVLPLITLAGYALVAFIPVFTLIRVFKLIENSTDYSLMNTARHALYLPLTAAQKYEGKTTIEAFFWRFGDLLQAGAIFVGLHWLQFDIREFAMLNVALSAAWLAVAWQLSRLYRARESSISQQHAPRIVRAPQMHRLPSGKPFSFELPADTFAKPDLGDVLSFTACEEGGGELPHGIRFNAKTLGFSGRTPAGTWEETVLIVRATDFDGAWAEGRLVLRASAAGEPP